MAGPPSVTAELLTVTDSQHLAAVLGHQTSAASLRVAAARGQLVVAARTPGGQRLFRRDDVARFVSERLRAPKRGRTRRPE